MPDRAWAERFVSHHRTLWPVVERDFRPLTEMGLTRALDRLQREEEALTGLIERSRRGEIPPPGTANLLQRVEGIERVLMEYRNTYRDAVFTPSCTVDSVLEDMEHLERDQTYTTMQFVPSGLKWTMDVVCHNCELGPFEFHFCFMNIARPTLWKDSAILNGKMTRDNPITVRVPALARTRPHPHIFTYGFCLGHAQPVMAAALKRGSLWDWFRAFKAWVSNYHRNHPTYANVLPRLNPNYDEAAGQMRVVLPPNALGVCPISGEILFENNSKIAPFRTPNSEARTRYHDSVLTRISHRSARRIVEDTIRTLGGRERLEQTGQIAGYEQDYSFYHPTAHVTKIGPYPFPDMQPFVIRCLCGARALAGVSRCHCGRDLIGERNVRNHQMAAETLGIDQDRLREALERFPETERDADADRPRMEDIQRVAEQAAAAAAARRDEEAEQPEQDDLRQRLQEFRERLRGMIRPLDEPNQTTPRETNPGWEIQNENTPLPQFGLANELQYGGARPLGPAPTTGPFQPTGLNFLRWPTAPERGTERGTGLNATPAGTGFPRPEAGTVATLTDLPTGRIETLPDGVPLTGLYPRLVILDDVETDNDDRPLLELFNRIFRPGDDT